MSSHRKPIRAGEPLLDAEHLVARLRARRRSLGFSLRDAADAIGVSAATLSRVESGNRLPGRETLLRITHWLGFNLDLSTPSHPAHRGDPPAPRLSTVEAVELYLRADPDLAPAATEALIEIFRIAYQRFATGGLSRGKASR